MNLFYQPQIPDGKFCLDADESRHCVKVLRKKKGDIIRITDGRGFFYDAVLTDANQQQCMFEVTHQHADEKRGYRIHIAISPTKNADRIEWFVEKTVELGIDAISLVECTNTERSFMKTERLYKVAVSAMKQSLKAYLPVIQPVISFSDFIQQVDAPGRFIAYVDPANPHHLKNRAPAHKHTVVLIGPEGDFTEEELKLALSHGFEKVSLGISRLRTETAGIAACHILNLVNNG